MSILMLRSAGGSSGGGGVDELYDLGLIPARFEVVEFADQPVTTSSETVDNQTELDDALTNRKTANAITLNPAGTFTGLTIQPGTSDLHIIATGATVSGSPTFDAGETLSIVRVKITGGTFPNNSDAQIIARDRASHITLDNVLAGGLNTDAFNTGTIYPHHLSLINSTFILNSGLSNTLFPANAEHLIVANCDVRMMAVGASPVRAVGCQNVIVVDSRFYVPDGVRLFRIHSTTAQGADLILLIRNQFEGEGNQNFYLDPDPGDGNSNAMTRIEFHDNDIYIAEEPFSNVAQMDSDDGGGIDDLVYGSATYGVNRHFGPVSIVTDNEPTNYVAGSNTFASYTTPPAFSGGADH